MGKISLGANKESQPQQAAGYSLSLKLRRSQQAAENDLLLQI